MTDRAAEPSKTIPSRGVSMPRGLAYLFVLVVFLAFAVAASAIKPRPVGGLPEDADVLAARDLMPETPESASPWTSEAGALRVRSSILGGEALSAPERDDEDLAEAAKLLARARARSPLDARIAAACGSVDLARGRLDRAERRFRDALGAAGAPYPEARLLLGVTLAERARRERLRPSIRSLELRAIAQLTAVPEDSPEYPAALYDRALLLARVGRGAEARECAREYFEIDPGSAWSVRLAREVAREG